MGGAFFSDSDDRQFDDSDDEDDEDEDSLIDPDSLGDWRNFRRNLATTVVDREDDGDDDDDDDGTKSRAGERTSRSKTKQQQQQKRRVSVSRANERVLKSQNKQLAAEYMSDVWAHEVATPEVGGLMVRLPLEVELFRSYKHSVTGAKLRKLLGEAATAGQPEIWYRRAQQLIEHEMLDIAARASENDGQINTAELKEESAEMLQMFLDNQETWQEVCLVLERNDDDGETISSGGDGTAAAAAAAAASTLVLNRPMALKLTENLAELVLYGAAAALKMRRPNKPDLAKFLLAFGEECAVYIGGPDDQQEAALCIHGIADLPGAVEISTGSGIYRGGIESAVAGVISGKYKPLDFRFFVGRHSYKQASNMDLAVLLGKYQPVACARAVALKQCLSLPKPLWHEVLELCGGEMKQISRLEMLKRDDLKIQIVEDEDDEDEGDLEYFGDDITAEVEELGKVDDEDEEHFS